MIKPLLVLALLATVQPALAQSATAPVTLPSGQAAAMVGVPVLKSPVQKGDTISAANIMQAEVPSAQVFASTVTQAEQLVGMKALRPLAAGLPVNRLHIRVATAVDKNQLVTIRYKSGAVELTVKGQALEDGQVGDTVRVINPATKATLAAVVTAPGIVDINSQPAQQPVQGEGK